MKPKLQLVSRSMMILAFAAWAIGIHVGPASAAAIFNVTKTADTDDGSCDLSDCSLREAVGAAETLAGADTIFVPGGEYPLTLGSLVIGTEMTIDAVSGFAIIDGGTTRVFEILGAGEATLTSLLITGGQADFGGGIYNLGTLNLRDSNVDNNNGQYGGGLYVGEQGTANLTGSSISGNIASTEGGGILNDGTLSLVNSIVDGNSATALGGGGISNAGGTVHLTGSEVSSNTASNGDGGGIFNRGTLTVTRTTLIDNAADQARGGGIFIADGNVEVLDSSLGNNVASGSGGAIHNGLGDLIVKNSMVTSNSGSYGGGVYNEEGNARIENSTLDVNFSSSAGGGFYNLVGEASVLNSTFSANMANFSGGGIYQISDQGMRVTDSTIVNNVSDFEVNNAGDGGGIFIGGGPSAGGIRLSNSILSSNSDQGTPQHPNCSGPLKSAGFNIIDDTTGCDVSLKASDSTDTPALAPALSENGGPTWTLALPPGSDAINHGPKGKGCKGTDQRGVPRKGRCDTGAYEVAFCGGVLINVVGTGGSDEISGTSGSDGILGKGGADELRGGSGGDRLCGGGGDDLLLGGGGNDKLFGAKGNDKLDGGKGNDFCDGGPGKNKYKSC